MEHWSNTFCVYLYFLFNKDFINLLLCPLHWDLVTPALTTLTHQPTIGLLSSHPVFTRTLHSWIIKLFALTGISRLSGYFCRFWQILPLIVWHNDSKQRHDKCQFRLFLPSRILFRLFTAAQRILVWIQGIVCLSTERWELQQELQLIMEAGTSYRMFV